MDVGEAVERLSFLPFEDLGYAKIDTHRDLRVGFPEVVYCQGKTPEQVAEILERLSRLNTVAMATRAGPETYETVRRRVPDAEHYPMARIIVIRKGERQEGRRGGSDLQEAPAESPERGERTEVPAVTPGVGLVGLVSAGTSDLPVAEEAAVSLEVFGSAVRRIYDVGVAGIHRLFAFLDDLRKARVLVVVAGMEGALPSVVAGLVNRPVIAVPTSTGYGASFGGLAALLAMLNSCAPGVAVVNIDNGFGAARLAHLINLLGEKDSPW